MIVNKEDAKALIVAVTGNEAFAKGTDKRILSRVNKLSAKVDGDTVIEDEALAELLEQVVEANDKKTKIVFGGESVLGGSEPEEEEPEEEEPEEEEPTPKPSRKKKPTTRKKKPQPEPEEEEPEEEEPEEEEPASEAKGKRRRPVKKVAKKVAKKAPAKKAPAKKAPAKKAPAKKVKAPSSDSVSKKARLQSIGKKESEDGGKWGCRKGTKKEAIAIVASKFKKPFGGKDVHDSKDVQKLEVSYKTVTDVLWALTQHGYLNQTARGVWEVA